MHNDNDNFLKSFNKKISGYPLTGGNMNNYYDKMI